MGVWNVVCEGWMDGMDGRNAKSGTYSFFSWAAALALPPLSLPLVSMLLPVVVTSGGVLRGWMVWWWVGV